MKSNIILHEGEQIGISQEYTQVPLKHPGTSHPAKERFTSQRPKKQTSTSTCSLPDSDREEAKSGTFHEGRNADLAATVVDKIMPSDSSFGDRHISKHISKVDVLIHTATPTQLENQWNTQLLS